MSKTYVRFGNIPENGISKVHRSDAIICDEKGLSVWDTIYANDVAFPAIPDNPSKDCVADYFYCLLGDKPVFLLEGEELPEKGHAGEPLLVNFKVIKEITRDYDYLKFVLKKRLKMTNEVIHCKDCKYRDYWGDCNKWSKELDAHKSYILDENMFCGFAENKHLKHE